MEITRERRTIETGIEVRAAEGGGKMLVGYAAVFNRPTRIGGIEEVVRPGAFTNSLADAADVRALYNHDPSALLGRTPTTLRLSENRTGLRYEIDLPDTQVGRDLMVSVDRGDSRGSSFGFELREGDAGHLISETKGGDIRRELVDLDLFDVSPVTFPAYEATEESGKLILRSLAGWIAQAKPVPSERLRRRLRLAQANL